MDPLASNKFSSPASNIPDDTMHNGIPRPFLALLPMTPPSPRGRSSEPPTLFLSPEPIDGNDPFNSAVSSCGSGAMSSVTGPADSSRDTDRTASSSSSSLPDPLGGSLGQKRDCLAETTPDAFASSRMDDEACFSTTALGQHSSTVGESGAPDGQQDGFIDS